MKPIESIGNESPLSDLILNADTPVDTHEAANFLGFAPYTLRRSRSTGKLAGVTAPKYRRIGRKITYPPPWLVEWRDQFKPQNSTAQNEYWEPK